MKLAATLTTIALLLSGCSSFSEGSLQEIGINTLPAGARCAILRDGSVIGMVSPTPGFATIRKARGDLQITCEKEGYRQASATNQSGYSMAALGNILVFGGVAGLAIDAGTGADNKYDNSVLVMMEPVEGNPDPISKLLRPPGR